VYLSCTCNFERETGTDGVLEVAEGAAAEEVEEEGTLHSLEIAIHDHQELCKAEAQSCPEVAFSLDPDFRCNWLQLFKRDYQLKRLFEVWAADG
jgi:hypothetical protein